MAGQSTSLVRGLFKTLSILAFVGFVGALLVGGIAFFVVVSGLPDVNTLKQYTPDNTTEVYSDEGEKIGEFYTERRYPVEFESIPKHVLYAFVSAEDSNFFEHKGIDFIAFARAAVSNVMAGRYAQGASTITQQVARGILLESRRKKIIRKLREMILAWQMEKELSKQEILGLYLNEIFLGHRAYGIGAAARNYFKKNVEDLNLAEGSMLAGLPQRPTYWNPIRDPYQAKTRQRYVLRRMMEEEYITEEMANAALLEPLTLYPIRSINSKKAPYFTEYVRLYLNKKYGEKNVLKQGYKVYTTVRQEFQKQAESSLNEGLRDVDKRLGWRGAQRHIATAEELQEFLTTEHEKIIKEETPARILPADVTAETNELLYDTSYFEDPNSPYFGNTPVKEAQYYQAAITEVWDEQKFAVASVGQTRVNLDLKTMDWVKIDEKLITQVSQALRIGDVVEVKIDHIDREKGVVNGTLAQKPELQGALLSYNVKTGFVEAMVGGTDFLKSQFNRALQAKRQVGSIFKPLVYAAAFDKGFSPSSVVTDSPVVFKYETGEDAEYKGEDWKPRNYSEKFVGEIPLRLALIKSKNVPTIKLLHEIGVDYTIEYARRLGIKADFPRDLTIALGSWSSSLEEIMRAYSIFPRLGRPVQLIYIKKVVSADGEVLEENLPDLEELPLAERTTMSVEEEENQVMMQLMPQEEEQQELAVIEPQVKEVSFGSQRVISPQTAYVMIDLLRSVVREGTGWRTRVVPGAKAGKTGTSNDWTDAWYIGFTPHVVSGIWVGYDENKSIGPGEAGGRVAAPIWASYMKRVVQEYPKIDFSIPEDIVFAYVDRQTGRLASPDLNSKQRVRVAFKVGTVPSKKGANMARVGEPGVRATSTSAITEGEKTESAGPVQPDSDYSDLLREGYQD